MKLYASPASSFARKIRVMLIEKNVRHDLEMVNLSAPGELRKVNPIGKVPALDLGDGRVLINSPLIAYYIESRFPDPPLIPADPDLHFEARCREAIADGVMDAVTASLHEMRFHVEEKRSTAWLERQRGKAEAGFAALENVLGDRAWSVGEAMSLADIAVACHITYITLRGPQFFPQDRYPNLTRLWKKMEARDSMRRTTPPRG
ncbi:MAG: glutathione S-transferase N-terminal domain-containing protein [Betaproteobacteria bacterium]|nr:glutathione S-transferase N-terminal domain-containing protein [Betaproteobacteria bacterium]